MNKNLKVLFLASEAHPFVKIGGLGDVAGSLPIALHETTKSNNRETDLDIKVVLPFYKCIDGTKYQIKKICSLNIPNSASPDKTTVFTTNWKGITFYFIQNKYISTGSEVYSLDTHKDGNKFISFSLAVLEFVQKMKWLPDIIHANDWHTALTLHAARKMDRYVDFFAKTKTLITLHNLPFMGAGTEKSLNRYLIPHAEEPGLPSWGKTQPLPMGLASADAIVAVSPGYARELLTKEYGCSLEGYLKTIRGRITGILNGLDMEIWNPSSDPNIPFQFSPSNLELKTKNKIQLASEFGLDPDVEIPLLILISRMDQQKGVDLAIEGLQIVSHRKWNFILLGSGNPILEAKAMDLQRKFSDQVRVVNRFDSQLSHRMYAAGDILLMPSRYEPCGLSQLISMRYGCIPVARSTGGLKDTIILQKKKGIGTGFLFTNATVSDFNDSVITALKAFKDKELWKKIVHKAMLQDFSWKKSASAYLTKYYTLVK